MVNEIANEVGYDAVTSNILFQFVSRFCFYVSWSFFVLYLPLVFVAFNLTLACSTSAQIFAILSAGSLSSATCSIFSNYLSLSSKPHQQPPRAVPLLVHSYSYENSSFFIILSFVSRFLIVLIRIIAVIRKVFH